MSILSIQSSVVLGHVGNAAAVLPLQRLGFEVWPVDTVRFSNHPGHGAWRGHVAPAAALEALIAGVGERGAFGRCRAVLSGYLGAPATARVVLDAVARVKAANPDAVYCCDPVIGDSAEGVYVDGDLATAFARDLVPAADLVVPNAFELGYLTGRPAGTVEEALAAADAVLAGGPGVVVVTSLPGRGAGSVANLAVTNSGAWAVETPRLETPAKGAGDVFAALFLGRWLAGRDVETALGRATASVFAVIEATVAAAGAELALVEAQDRLARPDRVFAACRLR